MKKFINLCKVYFQMKGGCLDYLYLYQVPPTTATSTQGGQSVSTPVPWYQVAVWGYYKKWENVVGISHTTNSNHSAPKLIAPFTLKFLHKSPFQRFDQTPFSSQLSDELYYDMHSSYYYYEAEVDNL